MKTEFFLLDTPGMMQTAGPQQAPIWDPDVIPVG
jgi:hypothetical protein